MKSIRNILFIIVTLCMVGCSTTAKKETVSKEVTHHSLVLYFSVTHNTESIAKRISELTDADLVEIKPEESYDSEDIDYNNNNSRANLEQNDDTARPAISNKLSLDDYDVIYLGYPIWWGKEPRIILTLLDQYDLTDKKIILFCTSGSSDITESMNDLKKYSSKLNIVDGKRFSSTASKEDIKTWLDTLDI